MRAPADTAKKASRTKKLHIHIAKGKQNVPGIKACFQPHPHRKRNQNPNPRSTSSDTLQLVVLGWVIYTLLDFSQQKMISNKLLVPKTEILNHNYDILLKCHPTPQFPPSKKM